MFLLKSRCLRVFRARCASPLQTSLALRLTEEEEEEEEEEEVEEVVFTRENRGGGGGGCLYSEDLMQGQSGKKLDESQDNGVSCAADACNSGGAFMRCS